MTFALALIIALFVLTLFALLLEIRKRRQIQKAIKKRGKSNHKHTQALDVILHNVHAYVLLIDRDFTVLKTNYYERTRKVDNKKEQKVGNLICCRNAILSGVCGTHENCAKCLVRNAITRAFQQKRGFANLQVSLSLAVSYERYVQFDGLVSASYINMENEECIVLTIYDITEQIRKEAALAKEKAKAEDANQSKSAYLANMSHEIRTPLNAIIGFSELLSSANTAEEKEQYLQIVRMNNEMLLQLVNDILDIAKIEAGTLEFTYSDVDINLLTSELDRQFEMKIKDKDKVSLVYEPSMPSCVLYTDRNRLTQVLFNFMSNALKFTESGTIRLGYKPHEKGIYFYVSDTGIGLKEEALNSVFGRFTRFHKEKKGNGLGLSISKTIIEKLGGEIGVDSTYGEGSTFWFILPTNNRPQMIAETVKPQVESRKEEIKEPVEKVETYDTGEPEEKKYTILIAEDMPDNYHLCAAILSKKYHLLWAQNGEEAIALFLQHQPDVILMDLKMPEVDGYAATEAIRQLSPTIPIIALTAFAYTEDRERVMRSGFSDFMTKPVNAGLLLDKVESFCKQYHT